MHTNIAVDNQPFNDSVLSPETKIPLSRLVTLNGETFELGSDWHLPMNQGVVDRVIEDIVRRQSADTFLCVGDVFDAQQGEDTSVWASDFLTKLSRVYERVLFTPGNHCLRSKDSPWSAFQLPSNVFMPIADQPLIIETRSNRCLVGNCLYDFKLVDPSLLSMTNAEIEHFYQGTKDGKFLLGIDRNMMESMAVRLACSLTSDITLLVTHTLPHPAAVTFRVATLTAEHMELSNRLGVPFIADPVEDELEAQKWNDTAEGFRKWWNNKSFIMGSNVLNRPESNPADGLHCVFGHNHRCSDITVKTANGASVHLLAHQPFGGDNPSAWQGII